MPMRSLTLTKYPVKSNTPAYQKVQTKTLAVRDTALISFPFNGFTHCLTLFSKFFASFPHGTCTLSVSCQYLALDEVYHPLNAALSSSATLWKDITAGQLPGNHERGCHPPWQSIPRHLGHRSSGHSFYMLQPEATQAASVSSLSCSRFTRRY